MRGLLPLPALRDICPSPTPSYGVGILRTFYTPAIGPAPELSTAITFDHPTVPIDHHFFSGGDARASPDIGEGERERDEEEDEEEERLGVAIFLFIPHAAQHRSVRPLVCVRIRFFIHQSTGNRRKNFPGRKTSFYRNCRCRLMDSRIVVSPEKS